MLSMLEIIEQPQGNAVKRLWHRLTKPSVSAYVSSAGYCSYLRIFCEPRRGVPDWRMIGAYTLDHSERILLPTDIEPPEEAQLRRYIPHEYSRRLLENMAMDILVCSEKQPELRRVAVYGQDCEVCALLPRLTKLAGEIRVITRRPQAVTDTVEELRRKNGAIISVDNQLDAAGFDMLLAPAGGASVFRLSESMIVLSGDRPSVPVNLWIKAARPSLPQVLEEVYDGRYDITEFVGAFYEAGQMRELGRMSPAAGITESGEVIASDAAKLIR